MSRIHKIIVGNWFVRIPALLTALAGLVNVFSAATPALVERLVFVETIFPMIVRRGSRLTTVLAGFALLLLAANLWRRKRLAWGITIAVLLLSALTHLIKGLDYEEALLSGGLAVWLMFLRPHFHARSDPPSVWQGVRVLAGALLFTLTYGVIGFYLLDRHFSINFGFGAALRQTVVMFTQFYDPGLEPITGFGRYFADSIYLVGFFTLGYAALLLARPVFLRRPASPAERERARQIITQYGCSALARLTLLDDKSYFFSAGGSAIAFAARGRVALALGDPIGPADDFLTCLQAFQQHCTRNDWQPAFYQVLPNHLEEYRSAGLQELCIGHEAVVDVTTFTLAGGENKSVRTTINKLNRLGFRAEIISPPLSHDLVNQLRAISDEWLTERKSVEMRFATGWFDDEYLRDERVIIIRQPDGNIQAFANLLPEYQRSEMTIDLMRHRSQVENGLMDFLFASLFQWAQAQGLNSFSLGLSALSGIGEHSDDPAIERSLHYIFEHVDQFYNFKGLHAFKEKFHPRWEPRYLIYPGNITLPSVALALAQANSGTHSL
jgi:phosphatidylglycerol lysyltransferase